MSLRYLLDTNVLSELARPRAAPQVMAAVEAARGSTATSATVWHELLRGTARLAEGRRKQDLQAWLVRIEAAIPILPYDAEAARWHAQQSARLMGLGRPPPYADGQIAAVAAVNGLVLVTRNVKDFEGYEGLLVEDWFQPTPARS
ncbi:MAG: type II toxin-antitoxin system VapC family toxin [Myxococcales bacterium]|nr:type II toxin-antitoxin system VapC family toxin [Myxococcales bacterium]